VYVCPLCITRDRLQAFHREALATAQLTVEHLPPRRAGGRPLVLTCAACNHGAGTALDAHAKAAGRLDAGPDGRLERPVRVTFGGHALNMTLSADGTGVRLFGDPTRNAPKAHVGFFDQLGHLAHSGSRN